MAGLLLRSSLFNPDYVSEEDMEVTFHYCSRELQEKHLITDINTSVM